MRDRKVVNILHYRRFNDMIFFNEYGGKNMDRVSLRKDEIEDIANEVPRERVKVKTETIARIFNKDRAENFISDWLYYLMKSNSKILEALLNCVDSKVSSTMDSGFEIEREYVFKDGRRIDFFISNENRIIGIENKIDSGEQENQLKDYSESLEGIAKGREVLKILLKPMSNNTKATGDFIIVTYEDLILELKKVYIDFLEDVRGAFLLYDFIKHIEENIVMKNGGKFEFNDWTLFLGKYSEQLKIIGEESKKEANNINEYIENQLKQIVNNFDEWKLVHKENKTDEYIQLYKNNWKSDKLPFVHFELLRKDHNPLPTSYIIRLDIELGSEDDKNEVAKLLGLPKLINILKEEMVIDYATSDTFNSSLTNIMKFMSKQIENYELEIDKTLKILVSQR